MENSESIVAIITNQSGDKRSKYSAWIVAITNQSGDKGSKTSA